MASNDVPAWVSLENIDPRRRSELALLVLNDDGDEFWVPYSAMHPNTPVRFPEHKRGTLIVRGWWAKAENLMGEEYVDESEL